MNSQSAKWTKVLRRLAFWSGVQCDAELPSKSKRSKVVSYCVKRMGHFGHHSTSNGVRF